MPITRREALLSVAAASLRASPSSEMPSVPFGPHRISKLIVGGNPVSGNSHVSSALSQEMIDYFTSENVKRLLRNCERAGINTWQSRGDKHIIRLLHEYGQEGGQLHWIAQTASEITWERNLSEMLREKPAGIYHHGTKTDAAWRAGKIESVRDTLKMIRQSGTRVGLGTHIPEVIDYVESKGWDVDFYMTCLFNLSRSEEEKKALGGGKAAGELFHDPDRVEMLKRVRQASKQCLVFKVYGASRHCDSAERMRNALRLALDSMKPNDAIVIGMFPKYKEQVVENCQLLNQAMRTS